MSTDVDESSSSETPRLPQTLDSLPSSNFKTVEVIGPWVDSVVRHVLSFQTILMDKFDTVSSTAEIHMSVVRDTAVSRCYSAIDTIQGIKNVFYVYEHKLFEKIKDGIEVATSHPLVTSSTITAFGFIALKRPRRWLQYKVLQSFMNEEYLLSQAEGRVNNLKESLTLLRAEVDKLQRRASIGEEELTRGRTKLRQAGKQIQGVIHSAYKIERRALGLRDILQDFPRREASKFRTQIYDLASAAKKERNALTKEVNKISNYGISV